MNLITMRISLDERIKSVISVMTRPNQVFREITNHDQSYFIFGIVIFALASFFFVGFIDEESVASLPVNEGGFVLDAWYQIQSFGESVLWNVLSVALIFYLGAKFGGNNNFKKVFSVITFALIPMLIGGMIMHVFALYPQLMETISGIDKESPEFAGLFWPLYFTYMPFVLWSVILSVKAIKIVDGFGTAKAFGLLVLSAVIVYVVALTISFGLG